MPQLDVGTYASQLFWLVVTFAALLVAMWTVVVPRISDVLEARQKRMEDNFEKAAELKKASEEAMAAYEKALAAARAEAHELIAETQEAIIGEAARKERELAQALRKQIADGEAAVRRAKDEALKGIRAVAAEVAAAAALKVARETFDAASVASAVDAAARARG